jgi:uncharacterized membrane protein YcaP (DUF421 family)
VGWCISRIADGAAAHIALIGILRLSGKRTLAKMRAFDLVVGVALGSTLATILLSRDVARLEGMTAVLTLVALQYAIAALSVRWRFAERLVKSDPQPLLTNGVIDAESGLDNRMQILADDTVAIFVAPHWR